MPNEKTTEFTMPSPPVIDFTAPREDPPVLDVDTTEGE